MRKYIAILLAIVPLMGFAKSITLYQKPATTAKVATTVQPGTPLIKIYSPKHSEWVKVANKKNGDVGWVKKSEVVIKAKSQAITFHRQFEHPGPGKLHEVGSNLKATKVRKVKNHDILV